MGIRSTQSTVVALFLQTHTCEQSVDKYTFTVVGVLIPGIYVDCLSLSNSAFLMSHSQLAL